ncbi:MAG TPA: phosphoenolpyruvate carboxylase, partial [Planctomycetota bacterium]|nr:phosphoenolpyruvate carboxylase [Planctomycetota bacterium]
MSAPAPRDQELRRDVRRLGRLLGALLREQGPAELYPLVERVRRASLARRRGEPGSGRGEHPAELLAGAEPALALDVARAFSTWFGLVNLAERAHRLRRRRDWRRARTPQPSGLEHTLGALAARGVALAEVAAALEGLTLEPVLTAHPTEAVRRTLLVKELRMLRALDRRSEHDAAAPARARAHSTALRVVRAELTAAWLTEEHLAQRPTVSDELEHALFFLGNPIRRATSGLRPALRRALVRAWGPAAGALAERPRFGFASWIGGDMDGNPNVGAATVRATLARHSALALELYVRDVRDLFRRLSISRSRAGRHEGLERRLAEERARLPEVTAEIPARYADMAYREFLWLVSARLALTRSGDARGYADARAFAADLATVAQALIEQRAARAGLGRVRRLEECVRSFGFHLAALDLRQDALEHRRALADVLGVPDFEERDAYERAELLRRALSTGGPAAPRDPAPTTRACLEVFTAAREVRARHGEHAIGLYVISMARGPDDALAVLALARAGGLVEAGAPVSLDVAPLFETVDDLQQAPRTLAALLGDPLWRAHLAGRGDLQWVMLGYSDSNKTSGLIAARVAIERAQRELLAVARERGVALRFFHGRGGSTSRGGSKPRAAVLAAPHDSLGGTLRVTEQGEIIRAKFGERGIAARTLELQLAALVERSVRDREHAEDALDPRLYELADASRAAYRALVEEHPDFLAYFQGATPIDVIERLGLGSRPSRRREMRGVRDLRAIPWVFAWTQCRLLLPGWYGAGQGLERFVRDHGVAELRELRRRSPALRTLLTDLEMVLAKAALDIAARYAPLAGERGPPLFAELAREHARATAHLLDVLERPRLLEDDPVLARAIELRNPYIDPMSHLQVDLLERWRSGGREDPA